MNNNSKLAIHAVGDVMLGEGPYYLDRGVRTAIQKQGFQYPFEKIKDLLGSADLVIGNLEVACSSSGETNCLRSRTFRGPEEGIAALYYSGFNVVSLANNHFLSHGNVTAEASYHKLKDYEINTVGWNPEKLTGKEAAIETITIKGFKVALIALCDVPTNLADETKRTDFPSIYEAWVLDSIRELKQEGYLVIITVHWGAEYIGKPDPSHIKLARSWIDQGADMILGHGPHVLQGYEKYNGRPIIYSMGNFIFDQYFCLDTSTSAIFRIETDCRHFDLSIVPVSYNRSCQVLLLDGEEKDKAFSILNDRCAQIPDSALDGTNTDNEAYQVETKKAYQQMQSNYLLYMIMTIPSLTIRSSLALLRDMWSRLYDFFR